MDNTLLEFGGAGGGVALDSDRRRGCPLCGARFSGDARFCPFDGEPLLPVAVGEVALDPLLGVVIDQRYQVIRVLGEGGMGTVYEVEHVTLQRRFALKALRRDLGRLEDLSARFMREAKAAAAINHPNVVQIADFGHLPTGEAYFVMELLGGVPLSTLIRQCGPMPSARVVAILRPVSEALAAAHEQGIIHRDLKPDNIQVCGAVGEREFVKVLDFGLAKVAGSSRLTRAGVVFGTPHYMSPEQASGDLVDHRSDVYAFGVVMYEMLTGRVPFEADTFMGVLSKHMYLLPTPPSEVIGDTSALGVLEDITLRCLQKTPAHRFGSMLELLQQLDDAWPPGAQGTPVQDGSAPTGRGRAPAPGERASDAGDLESGMAGQGRRGTAAALAWVLGGVAVVAVVGWVVWASSGSPVAEPVGGSSSSTAFPAWPGGSGQESTQAPRDEPTDARASSAPRAAGSKAEPAPGSSASPAGAGPAASSLAPRSRRESTPSSAGTAPLRPARQPSRIGTGEIVNPWEN